MGRSELDPRVVARVVAAYAFDAIRGRTGNGAGAAPAHRVAELLLEGSPTDKRTVTRTAQAGIPTGAPPASSATPFDFAFATLYDWSRNGGQASFEASLDLMADMVPRSADEVGAAIRSLLRFTVDTELMDPEGLFLLASGIESLALEHVRGSRFRERTEPGGNDPATAGSLPWARWHLDQRRDEYRRTTEGYEALLSFGLLLLRRRPRPGTTISQIVRAMQTAWTGGVHRALLLPEEYPEYGPNAPVPPASPIIGLPEGEGQIEGAMFALLIGMTEESLFSVNVTHLESRLIAEGLRRYRTADRMVSVADVIRDVDADADLVRRRFPTDQEFASSCVRWLAGDWQGFEPFALQFRSPAIAGVEALLDWVESVRVDFPALLPSAGFGPGDPAFDEVVSFTSIVLSRSEHGAGGVVHPQDVKRARRCVEAATTGGDWRTIAGLPVRTGRADRPD